MEKFTKLTGVAAPLPMINVDTDKIFPAGFLKTIKRTGLAKYLFDEIRFRPDGSENPDFVLNQGPYRNARIIVAGDNFGCGSSREHAPWALMDFGIRCVIAAGWRRRAFRHRPVPQALPDKRPRRYRPHRAEGRGHRCLRNSGAARAALALRHDRGRDVTRSAMCGTSPGVLPGA
jgi:3-isopropylmalate/(R)-2-methylmalate dehydratase small subunit